MSSATPRNRMNGSKDNAPPEKKKTESCSDELVAELVKNINDALKKKGLEENKAPSSTQKGSKKLKQPQVMSAITNPPSPQVAMKAQLSPSPLAESMNRQKMPIIASQIEQTPQKIRDVSSVCSLVMRENVERKRAVAAKPPKKNKNNKMQSNVTGCGRQNEESLMNNASNLELVSSFQQEFGMGIDVVDHEEEVYTSPTSHRALVNVRDQRLNTEFVTNRRSTLRKQKNQPIYFEEGEDDELDCPPKKKRQTISAVANNKQELPEGPKKLRNSYKKQVAHDESSDRKQNEISNESMLSGEMHRSNEAYQPVPAQSSQLLTEFEQEMGNEFQTPRSNDGRMLENKPVDHFPRADDPAVANETVEEEDVKPEIESASSEMIQDVKEEELAPPASSAAPTASIAPVARSSTQNGASIERSVVNKTSETMMRQTERTQSAFVVPVPVIRNAIRGEDSEDQEIEIIKEIKQEVVDDEEVQIITIHIKADSSQPVKSNATVKVEQVNVMSGQPLRNKVPKNEEEDDDFKKWTAEYMAKWATVVSESKEIGDIFLKHKMDGGNMRHISEEGLIWKDLNIKYGPWLKLKEAAKKLVEKFDKKEEERKK